MAYPGNPELSGEAQERVIAAFRQAISKFQEGQRQEATLGLEFVLRMDSAFAPAISLHQQLSDGEAEVDLSAVISQLQAPTTDAVNELLVEAVDAFNSRDFVEAKDRVKKVLRDLPGHREARELLAQVEDALKVGTQVGQFLAQAREALDGGDPEEAANFVMMAQALDPHASGIASMLEEIQNPGSEQQAPATPAAASPAAPPPPPAPAAPTTEEEPSAFETMAFDPSEMPVDFAVDAEDAPAEDFAFESAPAEPEAEAPADFAFEASAESDGPGLAFESDPETASPATQSSGFSFEPLDDDGATADAPADDGVGFGFESDNALAAAEEPASEAADTTDDFSFGSDGAFDSAPSGSLFDDDSGDVADLFDSGAESSGSFDAVSEPPAEVAGLVQQGQAAFDRGEFGLAVETWSKVYALDANNADVGDLIDRARARLAETEQQVSMMMADASDAEQAGNKAKALDLINAVLGISPQQPEAIDMKRRLDPDGAASAAPGAADITPPPSSSGIPTLDDVEEDLFDDVPSGGGLDELDELPDISLDIPDAGKKTKKAPKGGGLPLRLVAAIVAGLIVIAGGAWMGHRFMSGNESDGQAEAVNQILEQAEALVQQRQFAEAIHLLQEFPASELDRERILRRIKKYQQAQTPPTPTPIPAFLAEAEALLGQGLWMAALTKAETGIAAHPQDIGLADLERRIKELDADLSPLANSLKKGDFETAVIVSLDLSKRHPDHPEFTEIYTRSLYNSALSKLRSYNMGGALSDLSQLVQIAPDDEDALRVQDFITGYRSRPVDMRLKIFIGNLKER